MRLIAGLLLCWSLVASADDCPLDRQGLVDLRRAADAGQSEAQFELGVYYFQGTCVEPDMQQSTHWFDQAARQGHGPAAFNLGNAYHHGRGIAQDTDKAHYWWRRAAFKGLPNAAYNLGVWYLKHHRTRAHRELGVAWLEVAADADWADAAALLARLPISSGPASSREWSREPLRSESRLLTRPPTAYVIQLFSGESRDSARRFVTQHRLGDNAVVFRLPVDGAMRWNVAFGDYPSHLAAKETLRTLREDLAGFNPWPRAVAKTQATIIAVWRQQEQTQLAETW